MTDFYVTAPHDIKSFELYWKLSHLGNEPLEGDITIVWDSQYQLDVEDVDPDAPKANTDEVLHCIAEDEP